ncbi:MAG: ribonuclease III [Chloroflexi bacterium RBG_16_64_32]|nr:MAG: ribonuclease III [Chloroflexi bacterium RBG_16_64_32]
MATETTSKAPDSLLRSLDIEFRQHALVEQALVHRSYLNEAPELDLESNERMEFLGDAVLGIIISDRLYRDYPALSEGHLSQVRALLVRWDTLAQAAERICLGEYLILGRGEEMSGGRTRPSNLAGALEALIGAAFLDGGMTKARKLVLQCLQPELDKIAAGAVAIDSKSQLQHVVQARWHEIPKYRLVSAVGPDHAKTFTVEVVAHSEVLGQGEGRNKKQAELAAASEALDALAASG